MTNKQPTLVTMSQVLLVADTPNRNNRIYSKKVCEKIVADVNASNNLFPGMFYSGKFETSVPLNDMILYVTRLDLNGNDVVAQMNVLDTEKGRLLKSMLANDSNLCYSIAGEGDVSLPDENGVVTVTNYTPLYINVSLEESTNG